MSAKNTTKDDTMTIGLSHYKGCPSDPGRQDITVWHQPPRFPESVVCVIACLDCAARKIVDRDTGEEYGEPAAVGPLQGSSTYGGQ